jgi:putative membrane protein
LLAFLTHLILTAALILWIAAILLLGANLVRGVQVQGWGPALVSAIVLGFANAVVPSLMVLLTLPLTILTFGLFLLVVNALMLWLVAALVPGIRVQGFRPALLGSLVLTLLNLAISLLITR